MVKLLADTRPLLGVAAARPHPGQGRVQRELDLVLQLQVRTPKHPKQVGQVVGNQLVRVGQGRIRDQLAHGWRRRRR
jgi:hypothetical protein